MKEILENIADSFFTCSRIIGINGVDTSGKTVFAQNLSRYFSHAGIKNAVIHMDDFLNPASIRKLGSNETEAYYNNAFDYDKLIA